MPKKIGANASENARFAKKQKTAKKLKVTKIAEEGGKNSQRSSFELKNLYSDKKKTRKKLNVTKIAEATDENTLRSVLSERICG